MRDVLIGRHPIFDFRLSVRAYELLFRFGERAHDPEFPRSVATAEVLTEALTTFGLDRLVGAKPAHVNVTRSFLLAEGPLPVSPDRLVLEISASYPLDAELYGAIARWRARGFRIAADDVRYDQREHWPLYERVDILKVDFLGRGEEELAREVQHLFRHQKTLLAEKLETRVDVDRAVGMGFDLLQGYFLERPGVVRTRTVEPARAALVRLVVELQDPACDVPRVEAIVLQDAGLSFRILRCVNSAAFAIPRRIDSIAEAVLYLGLATVRNLACLLFLSTQSDQPRELVRMAMFRARLCELFARELGQRERSRCFTVGLLSLFDALLGETLPELLEHLPVSDEVRAALLDRRGDAGHILNAAIALERGDWTGVLALGLAPERVQEAWLSAVQWVDELDAQMATGSA